MVRYAYAYQVSVEDKEAFFNFPKFPEIISALPEADFARMDEAAKEAHAHDAVVTALQAIIGTDEAVPEPDNPLSAATGFVRLSPLQAMKLQLYRVYLARGYKSVSDFARQIGKQDTTARRLLNLRHRSVPDEIEDVLTSLGCVLEHDWNITVGTRQPAMTVGSVG